MFVSLKKVLLILAVMALALAACAQAGSGPDTGTPSPQATLPPESTEMATTPPAPTEPAPAEYPAAVESARQALARQLQLDLSEITVVSFEHVEWPDACLGVEQEGQMCAQVITPGYRVVLEAGGERYEVHTDETGGSVQLATAQALETPETEADVAWESAQEPCETALISSSGVVFGACGGPAEQGEFVSDQRSYDLSYFVSTYASFRAETPAGKVTLNGQGQQTASPAEERMIAEWAGLVYQEAVAEGSSPAQGLALTWHREGGFAGFCDDLAVYVSGDVLATPCQGAQPDNQPGMRMDAEQLEQLYGWVDSLKSFVIDQTDKATADAMTIRLVFSGNGSREATEAEKQAILDFAAQLYTEASAPASL